ncbi:hypothetical protein P691DRAFT_654706 [Macrolepiota fuliginosa MF-IS2]|uniref:Pal1-domain-containing protein n=1 Tax=Macrolepiota fuliginosa MF-IS2 TaxID=1400762 RepID=A0A9P6CBG2_9AGAR|nr:hypothetical protein P691DRAFT_654706 [Macrolepiota fuliginosa MF-IS2]
MPTAVQPPPPISKDIHDITEAVRDTVTLKDRSESPRTRMGRSHTTPTTNSRSSTKRSQSQDSAVIAEKPRSSGKSRGKKSSQHADVIDRLDFTGVGLFHHDGPFDACAPSRNKQRNKAPLYAWSGVPDPTQYGDSAYPSAHAYTAFSNDYPDPPKKKVDAIAEAWGIHEPEPYEEFFAGGGSTRPEGDTPASSIYNGRDSHNPNSTRSGVPKRGKDEVQQPQVTKEQRPRGATRRSLVPPPQPIFVPDPAEGVYDISNNSPPASSPGFPKRQKSLMQRIRKMRDAPNVPVGPEYAEYEQPPSPNSPLEQPQTAPNPSRPTHRSQNSFLGRFGKSPQPQGSEPFLLIDPLPSNKELPPPPMASATNSRDSAQTGVPQDYASPGINRKTSIMKKMGRVVRGTR